MKMTISLTDVKQLREVTQAPITACKEALEESEGDFEKAKEIIKKRGQDVVSKKSSRESKEGLIGSYVHSNGKIGVLVKVHCETDFVARNEEFQNFVHEVALQIAATDPKFVDPEDIEDQDLAKEKQKIMDELASEKKPAEVLEKIVSGKLEKLKNEISLLPQPLIKDPEKTLGELLTELTAKLSEKIEIGEFQRLVIE